MYRLSFLIVLLLGYVGSASAQNPHGEGMILECKDCHNPGSWSVDLKNIAFSHDTVGFNLEGRHEQTSCKDCHTTLVFEEVGNECVDCHTDVHSMSVGNDCVRCHNSENWLVTNIPELHEQNGFPLLGQHRVADCTDCHRDESELAWNRIGNECVSCHLEDYMAASEPNHQLGGISTECTECHAPLAQDWTVDNFHLSFPLENGHDIQDCAACHIGNDYAAASPECVSCHQDDFDATTEPDHQAAGFSTDCLECHSSLADSWGSDNFHLSFPLENGHDIQDCAACHVGNDYAAASPECVSCHQDDFDATSEPDHQAAGFSTDCLECHSSLADSWGSDNFHLSFPLENGHDIQDCAACHIGNDYAAASPECVSCHQDDFDAATEPDHQAAGFSTDCLECHSSLADSWGSDNFHLSFPLENGHDIQDCAACHIGNDYAAASPECVSCHQDDFDATSEPDHQAAGFSTDCLECHSSLADSWGSDNFHLSFPLEAGHNIQDCAACHTGNDYGAASSECVSCHQDDFDATTEPDHQAAGFSTDCLECHSSLADSWGSDNFHLSFPLEAGHNIQDCNECHTGNDYAAASPECISCHLDDFQGSTQPDHQAAGFSTDCLECHSSLADSWGSDNFHLSFPLEAGHDIQDCAACHVGNDYAAASPECVSCHQDDFDAATEPDHQAAGFSTDCLECHSSLADSWGSDNFHLSFPLENGHDIQDCAACHIGNDYAAASPECVSCHQDDFDAATEPDHQAAGFSTDCLECHSSLADSWGSENFHLSFPLENGHDIQDCAACHIGNDYAAASPECVSCHQDDFDAATEPDHQAAGFSTDCLECHSSLADSWGSDNFHLSFPLEAGHNIQDCAACHIGNDYAAASPECVSCHQDDFDATSDPDHQAAGFSTDCLECHSSLADSWGSDNFHLSFPLEAGHNIQDCNECHIGNDYAAASPECVSCHQDDFDATSEPDHQAAGFSTDCLECHSSLADSWGSDNFHLSFPLEAGHNIQDCNECHIGNDYSAASPECVSCHQDDFDATSEPDHQAAGFSTYCLECHSSLADSWGSDNFHLSFPLEAGHNIQDCNECHTGNDYASASPECVFCHLDDFQGSTQPDHQAAGFSTDCLECHSSLADSWGSDNFHLSFPLEAGHDIQDCAACHDGNEYTSASPVCISCHQDDFNNANSPDHVDAGFSTNCLDCHSTNNWDSAILGQHDGLYFPIFSGKHDNEWNSCDECHTTPGNYTMFSCIDCHEHDDPTDLADIHDEDDITGYVYESNSCYNCHPTGSD
jgi:hypothetical protein